MARLRTFDRWELTVRVPDGAIETDQAIHDTSRVLDDLAGVLEEAATNWVAERIPHAVVEVSQ